MLIIFSNSFAEFDIEQALDGLHKVSPVTTTITILTFYNKESNSYYLHYQRFLYQRNSLLFNRKLRPKIIPIL